MKKFTALFLAFVMTLSLFVFVLPSASAAQAAALSVADQNKRQAQMVERARKVVEVSWKFPDNAPVSWFYEWKYKDSTGNYLQDKADIQKAEKFEKGKTYYGLPYSRPGIWQRILSGKYANSWWWVGLNRTPKDLDQALASFKTKVANKNDTFWTAAKECGQNVYSYVDSSNTSQIGTPGPLYGLDCSSYVSMIWEITHHTCSYLSTDRKCNTVILSNFSNTTDLDKIKPADIFVNRTHTIFVAEVYRDSNNKVTRIVTMEETPPRNISKSSNPSTVNYYNKLTIGNSTENIYSRTNVECAGAVRRDFDTAQGLNVLFNKLKKDKYGLYRCNEILNASDRTNQTSTNPPPPPPSTGYQYYPKYTGNAETLNEILRAIGAGKYAGSVANRKPLAIANGINNYSGTATQNMTLIKLAKQGKLLRPCYPKYTGNAGTLNEILRAIGAGKYAGSVANRKPLAIANGIDNYRGTAEQNITLINYAKQGTLVIPS